VTLPRAKHERFLMPRNSPSAGFFDRPVRLPAASTLLPPYVVRAIALGPVSRGFLTDGLALRSLNWLRRLFETASRPCPIKRQPFDRVVKEVALANGIDPELIAQRIEDWGLVTSEAAVHRAGPMPPTITGRQ